MTFIWAIHSTPFPSAEQTIATVPQAGREFFLVHSAIVSLLPFCDKDGGSDGTLRRIVIDFELLVGGEQALNDGWVSRFPNRTFRQTRNTHY
jgi:hypothetical protein